MCFHISLIYGELKICWVLPLEAFNDSHSIVLFFFLPTFFYNVINKFWVFQPFQKPKVHYAPHPCVKFDCVPKAPIVHLMVPSIFLKEFGLFQNMWVVSLKVMWMKGAICCKHLLAFLTCLKSILNQHLSNLTNLKFFFIFQTLMKLLNYLIFIWNHQLTWNCLILCLTHLRENKREIGRCLRKIITTQKNSKPNG